MSNNSSKTDKQLFIIEKCYQPSISVREMMSTATAHTIIDMMTKMRKLTAHLISFAVLQLFGLSCFMTSLLVFSSCGEI